MRLPPILPGMKRIRAKRAKREARVEESMRKRRAFQCEAARAREDMDHWGTMLQDCGDRARQVANASTAKTDGLFRRASAQKKLHSAGLRVLNTMVFADAKTPAEVREIQAEKARARGRAALAEEYRVTARENRAIKRLMDAQERADKMRDREHERAWVQFSVVAQKQAARERQYVVQAAAAQKQLHQSTPLVVRAQADAASIRPESMQLIGLKS